VNIKKLKQPVALFEYTSNLRNEKNKRKNDLNTNKEIDSLSVNKRFAFGGIYKERSFHFRNIYVKEIMQIFV